MQIALPSEEKKPEDWQVFQLSMVEHQISFEILDPFHELGVLTNVLVDDLQDQ